MKSYAVLPRAFWVLPFAALGALGFAAACSANGEDDGFESTQGQGGGSTQSSGDPSGTGGDIFTSSGGSGTGGNGTGGGCLGVSSIAEKVPLDIFLMLDQSGSMSDPVNGGGTKWDAVTGAINAFVAQPQTAGIGFGMQYFGLPASGGMCQQFCMTDADCGGPACGPCFLVGPMGICLGAAGGDSCNAADYATAAVAIQPLPGVASQITSSIAMHAPSTGTPTSAALQGAIDYAKVWATMNPTHVTVVVFATDGDPSTCDTNLANINAIAAAGYGGMPSILTFVIGVGGSVAALNGFAAAGGTNQAYIVDSNANAQQEFLDAMNDIQGKALPCAFSIPPPPDGETVDFGQVNVEYTPGSGGNPETIPKVDNEGACGAGGGWYYDNNSAPTLIVLCPATCEKLALDTKGEVNIVLGCATIAD